MTELQYRTKIESLVKTLGLEVEFLLGGEVTIRHRDGSYHQVNSIREALSALNAMHFYAWVQRAI